MKPMASSSSPPCSSSSSSTPNQEPPRITQEQLFAFHNIDRQLFSRLVFNLRRDPSEAMNSAAFWLWLEQCHINAHFVHYILSFPDPLIEAVHEETLLCLRAAETDPGSPDLQNQEFNASNLPMIESVTGMEGVSPWFFHENRLSVRLGMSGMLQRVCLRAFQDLIQMLLTNRAGPLFNYYFQNQDQPSEAAPRSGGWSHRTNGGVDVGSDLFGVSPSGLNVGTNAGVDVCGFGGAAADLRGSTNAGFGFGAGGSSTGTNTDFGVGAGGGSSCGSNAGFGRGFVVGPVGPSGGNNANGGGGYDILNGQSNIGIGSGGATGGSNTSFGGGFVVGSSGLRGATNVGVSGSFGVVPGGSTGGSNNVAGGFCIGSSSSNGDTDAAGSDDDFGNGLVVRFNNPSESSNSNFGGGFVICPSRPSGGSNTNCEGGFSVGPSGPSRGSNTSFGVIPGGPSGGNNIGVSLSSLSGGLNAGVGGGYVIDPSGWSLATNTSVVGVIGGGLGVSPGGRMVDSTPVAQQITPSFSFYNQDLGHGMLFYYPINNSPLVNMQGLPPSMANDYGDPGASSSNNTHTPSPGPIRPNFHSPNHDPRISHNPPTHDDLVEMFDRIQIDPHQRPYEVGLGRVVPFSERTIFLTFSKGYPISEDELKDFLNRAFGNIIEALYFQEVGENEQPLYARLVVPDLSTMYAILGSQSKAKFSINGKHVWARKYVRKTNPNSPPSSPK